MNRTLARIFIVVAFIACGAAVKPAFDGHTRPIISLIVFGLGGAFAIWKFPAKKLTTADVVAAAKQDRKTDDPR